MMTVNSSGMGHYPLKGESRGLRPSHWMCVAAGAGGALVTTVGDQVHNVWQVVFLALSVLVLRLAGLVAEHEDQTQFDRGIPPGEA